MAASRIDKVKTAFNREILEEKENVDLLATCTTLSKVIGNLVSHPDEPKFRKVPCESKLFNETVVKAKGGLSFIVACGFVKQNIGGKDFWVLEPTPEIQEALVVALELVNSRIGKVQKKTAEELAAIEKQRVEEEQRKANTAALFSEARKDWDERLEMTGGTQASIATKLRTPEELAKLKVQPGRAPGFLPGVVPGPVPGVAPGAAPGGAPGFGAPDDGESDDEA